MLDVISQIVSFAAGKWGIVGEVVAYLVIVVAPIVSVLIEVAEAVVKLTTSEKDDAAVSKVKAYWAKILPVMEVLPHVNIPIADGIVKIVKIVQKVGTGILGLIQGLRD